MKSDTDLRVEYVRQALALQITKQYVDQNETLKVITISNEIENMISNHIQQTEHGNYLALEPNMQETIIQNIHKEMEKVQMQHEQVVILCSPAIRMYLKQLIERVLPQIVVLSYNELASHVQVQSVGVVNVA